MKTTFIEIRVKECRKWLRCSLGVFLCLFSFGLYVGVAPCLASDIGVPANFGLGPLGSSDFYSASRVKGDDKTVTLIHPPKRQGPEWRDRIFNPRLTKEFQSRYDEEFSRTEHRRAFYSYELSGYNRNDEPLYQQRRRFGEFMFRRLFEYHVGEYAQKDPVVRPLWEIKEKVSQAHVEINQVRVDFSYSVSGNILDIRVENPWLQAKSVVKMNPDRFGPGPVEELIAFLARQVTPSVLLEGHYYFFDGVAALTGKKQFSNGLIASLSVSTFTREQGLTQRESVYIGGLACLF